MVKPLKQKNWLRLKIENNEIQCYKCFEIIKFLSQKFNGKLYEIYNTFKKTFRAEILPWRQSGQNKIIRNETSRHVWVWSRERIIILEGSQPDFKFLFLKEIYWNLNLNCKNVTEFTV